MEYNNLNQVTKKSFDYFIKDKDLKKVSGEKFHSDYWEDEKGEKVAYLETSSWGGSDIYMIKGGVPFGNQKTIDVFSSIVRNKENYER